VYYNLSMETEPREPISEGELAELAKRYERLGIILEQMRRQHEEAETYDAVVDLWRQAYNTGLIGPQESIEP